jgi:Tectonin domain
MSSKTYQVLTVLLFVSLCSMTSHHIKDNMSSWKKLNGSDGRDIAVNEKGEFFLVNTDGELYQYIGPNWKELKDVPGNILVYAEKMGIKARTTASDDYKYLMTYIPGNNPFPRWVGSATIAKDVDIAQDGTIWFIKDKLNWVSKMNGPGPANITNIQGSRIATGGGQVWVINTSMGIYRLKNPGKPDPKWEQMPGMFARDITVTNDGHVFMVNQMGNIFQWNSTKWTKLDGSDGVRIAANNGKIALVNTDGEIYTRNY